MVPENSNVTAQTRIRTLIDARVKAVHDKNIDALLANHAPGISTFDVLNPLQYSGVDAVRERAQQWFSAYQSAIGYEVRDLQIMAGESHAFCHYLYHITGIQKDGGTVDMWVRATLCLQQIAGKWLIVHEHQSVPFDAQTGKASLDLKP